jgi:hypothetical protein
MGQRSENFYRLKVTTTGQIGQGTVELDGQDISEGLTGIDLRLHAGELNAATLELKAPMSSPRSRCRRRPRRC